MRVSELTDIKQITKPEDLEIGREYRLIWKGKTRLEARTERLRGESLGYQWFTNNKIWACDNNPQAFDRWDIYGPLPEPIDLAQEVERLNKHIEDWKELLAESLEKEVKLELELEEVKQDHINTVLDLADTQRERDDLQLRISQFKFDFLNKCHKVHELAAYVERLREALVKVRDSTNNDSRHYDKFALTDIAHIVLLQSPSTSLQQHDNEVIERCAKLWESTDCIYDVVRDAMIKAAKAIRALKTGEDNG